MKVRISYSHERNLFTEIDVNAAKFGNWVAHEIPHADGWRVTYEPYGACISSLVDQLDQRVAERIAERLCADVPKLPPWEVLEWGDVRYIVEGIVAESVAEAV